MSRVTYSVVFDENSISGMTRTCSTFCAVMISIVGRLHGTMAAFCFSTTLWTDSGTSMSFRTSTGWEISIFMSPLAPFGPSPQPTHFFSPMPHENFTTRGTKNGAKSFPETMTGISTVFR